MSRGETLRCTAFEELMLGQDSASYPCNIYVRMTVSGQLDRACFDAAVQAMIQHHPLLKAKRRVRFGRSSWMIDDSPGPTASWGHYSPEHLNSSDRMNVPAESQFDLTTEYGLQIEVLEPLPDNRVNASETDEPLTLVAMKMHHAVADGLGMNAAIHDLWLAYDALVDGRPVKLSDCHPERLSQRNRFIPDVASLLRWLPKQLVGLLGVRQYLMRQPQPLVPISNQQSQPAEPLAFAAIGQTYCAEWTKGIRQAAKGLEVSVNDYLAACVLRACHRFRSEQGLVHGSPWLRMMIPVSLRTGSEFARLPACNVVSSVFLDRTPADLENFDRLVKSVHEEMELIKNNRLALMFIFSLWIRKLLTWRSNKSVVKTCQTSVVFSNLGKLFHKSSLRGRSQNAEIAPGLSPGNVVLESYQIYAPLTPYMVAAFSTLIYRDQLQLSLRYDPRLVDQDQAQSLMDYVTCELAHLRPVEALAS